MVSWLTMFPEEWDYAVPMQLILNGRDGYFASARQMNTNGSGKYDACWISRNMYNDRWSDQIMAPPKANFFRGSLVTVIWGSNSQSELVNGRDILLTFSRLNGRPHRDDRQLVYNKAIWVATLGFEPNERHDSGEDRYGQFKGWIAGWSEYREPVRNLTSVATNEELALADCFMSDIDVLVDDQSDPPVANDQPVDLVLGREVLKRAKSDLEARLKSVNITLKSIEERLDSSEK